MFTKYCASNACPPLHLSLPTSFSLFHSAVECNKGCRVMQTHNSSCVTIQWNVKLSLLKIWSPSTRRSKHSAKQNVTKRRMKSIHINCEPNVTSLNHIDKLFPVHYNCLLIYSLGRFSHRLEQNNQRGKLIDIHLSDRCYILCEFNLDESVFDLFSFIRWCFNRWSSERTMQRKWNTLLVLGNSVPIGCVFGFSRWYVQLKDVNPVCFMLCWKWLDPSLTWWERRWMNIMRFEVIKHKASSSSSSISSQWTWQISQLMSESQFKVSVKQRF